MDADCRVWRRQHVSIYHGRAAGVKQEKEGTAEKVASPLTRPGGFLRPVRSRSPFGLLLREIGGNAQQFGYRAKSESVVPQSVDDIGKGVHGVLKALADSARGVEKDDGAGTGMGQYVGRHLMGGDLGPIQAVHVPQDDQFAKTDRFPDDLFA